MKRLLGFRRDSEKDHTEDDEMDNMFVGEFSKNNKKIGGEQANEEELNNEHVEELQGDISAEKQQIQNAIKEKEKPNSGFFAEKIREKTNMFLDAGRSIIDKTVNSAESALEKVGDNPDSSEEIMFLKQSIAELDTNWRNKYDNLEVSIDELNKKISYLDKFHGQSFNLPKDSNNMAELVTHMSDSSSFMKNISHYLKDDASLFLKAYLEENVKPLITKIKEVKIEELNLVEGLTVKMKDLDLIIHGKEQVIKDLDDEIYKGQRSVDEILKEMVKETKTLENITTEITAQGEALSLLKRSVEQDKKIILEELEEFSKQEKIKVENDVKEYKENAVSNLQVEVENALDHEINLKIKELKKIFDNSLEGLSEEMKKEIFNKMLNK